MESPGSGDPFGPAASPLRKIAKQSADRRVASLVREFNSLAAQRRDHGVHWAVTERNILLLTAGWAGSSDKTRRAFMSLFERGVKLAAAARG